MDLANNNYVDDIVEFRAVENAFLYNIQASHKLNLLWQITIAGGSNWMPFLHRPVDDSNWQTLDGDNFLYQEFRDLGPVDLRLRITAQAAVTALELLVAGHSINF